MLNSPRPTPTIVLKIVNGAVRRIEPKLLNRTVLKKSIGANANLTPITNGSPIANRGRTIGNDSKIGKPKITGNATNGNVNATSGSATAAPIVAIGNNVSAGINSGNARPTRPKPIGNNNPNPIGEAAAAAVPAVVAAVVATLP